MTTLYSLLKRVQRRGLGSWRYAGEMNEMAEILFLLSRPRLSEGDYARVALLPLLLNRIMVCINVECFVWGGCRLQHTALVHSSYTVPGTQ